MLPLARFFPWGNGMAKDLTALGVSAEKPGSTRREVADGKVRGLYLIVQPSGKKSWALRYRLEDGTSRKHTLGSFPGVGLEAARRLANGAITVVAAKGDPAAERARARKAAREPKDHELVENVVERFIERYAKKHTRETSWMEAQRLLNVELVKTWRGRPLSEIKKSDIHAILDRILDRGSPIAANRALAGVMGRMFSWSVEREIIGVSPCSGIKPPSPARNRDRVLTDNELRLVWDACVNIGWPFGPLLQLLILTGQRRNEVGGMTWPELDMTLKLWQLPKGRVKNDKGHTVPLSKPALDIVETLPRVVSKADFVFSTTGLSAVSGFTNAKERLDRIVAAGAGTDIPDWTIHDLRRTLASGCARLGVAPQVVEAILNHKSGTIRGVAAVYNRYDHFAEKRAALDLWGRHVEALVGNAPDAAPLVSETGVESGR